MESQINSEYSPYIFEVENIIDKRIHPKSGKTEYLVQWKQWPHDTTWEPAQNIQSFIDQKLSDDQCLGLKQRKQQKIEEKIKKIDQQVSKKELNQDDSILDLDNQVQSLLGKYDISISDSETQNDKKLIKKKTQLSKKLNTSDENGNIKKNIKTEPVYKILDKQGIKNTLYYLVLYYDEQLPQWVEKEKLSDIEIQEFENQQLQASSNSLLEDSMQSINKDNSKIESCENNKNIDAQEKYQIQENECQTKIQDSKSLNEEGDLLTDQIENIQAEFNFTYHINWKPRKNGEIPKQKQVQHVKSITITPQEFIDQILLNKFIN